MKIAALTRIVRSCTWRVQRQLLFNFAVGGARAVRAFERRCKENRPFFPAFTMISLTNRCNLQCRGCWVEQTVPAQELSVEQLNGVVNTARRYGSNFFGILGGEPLLHKGLYEFMAAHPWAYFQLFSNGIGMTSEVAVKLAAMGNVTPLISIEGLENESRRRRGRDDVFARALAGVDEAVRAGLFVGVAASIARSNFVELVSDDYLNFLIKRGVHYLWYYIYRPAGRTPEPENALSAEQIVALRRFIVERRRTAKILIIDAYWDQHGRALCPAAIGLSHHISPGGAIEFCPPLQFCSGRLDKHGANLEALYQQPGLLPALREYASARTRGCILLQDPAGLAAFMREQGAEDSSCRDALAELSALPQLPCHEHAEPLLPEKSWAYRLIKKYYFFGFGVYG
ncbi:MAG: radical SAM protein [Lentisphaerae bacterium]|nr:radical SAM protein [Lentisphaerota bacterium]